jgi:hypothetical protein
MASDKNEQKSAESPANINNDYNQEQTNGNHPDPSAKRNVGLNGATQRGGQMDKLENMHIGGDETTGYGANDPDSVESIAQGPGFEFEGSYDEMDGSTNGIRTEDQPLGSKETKPNDSDYSRI